MGYSQQAHTWYGWVTEITPEISKWQEEIDYKSTKGFFSIDLDGHQCAIGVELFISTDARWEVLSGHDSFTQEEAEVQFQTWKSELTEPLKSIVEGMETEPKFHSFCTYL